MEKDDSTESKIRKAAKDLFVKKGFSITVRDVAERAGVNVALVNYYFRSKEKLYQSIFDELFDGFNRNILPILNNEELSLEEIVTKFINTMIDHIKKEPNLPLFIINEMHKNADKYKDFIKQRQEENKKTILYKRMRSRMEEGTIKKVDPLIFEVLLNAMIMYPFFALPLAAKFNDLKDAEFLDFLESYKKAATEMILGYLKSTS